MKHLNIKIGLLALTSLLATGYSMANESGLSSTNSSAGKYSYVIGTVDSENVGINKLFPSPELNDSPFLLVKKCEINGEKGKICKTTNQCLPRGVDCPKKQKSPHNYKETTSDSHGI